MVESKQLFAWSQQASRLQQIAALRRDEAVLKLVKLETVYDRFVCGNMEPFSHRLLNYLKRKNPKLELCWLEDGLGTYSFEKDNFVQRPLSLKRRLRNLVIKTYEFVPEIKRFYFFRPDCVDFNSSAEFVQIPPLSQMQDSSVTKELRRMFDMDNCPDKYSQRFIFFEDGYSDLENCKDTVLLEEVARVVGKENIAVKIHPRNPINRFMEQGYATNRNTVIPWEVLAASISMKGKVLLTMYSQAVLTPYILLGEQPQVIVLSKLAGLQNEKDKVYFNYLNKYFYSREENIYVPETVEELKVILSDKLGENREE